MITQSTKRILPIAIALLVFSAAWDGWLAASHAQTGDSIQSIRQQYAVINKRVAKYKKVKKQLSGFSLEGGELVAYMDGPAVVKIVATHYGEGGKAVEEYYYQNGRLIFVYRKDSIYDRPMSGRVVRTEENRFYFSNDRLIRWIDGSARQVNPDTSEYRQKQNEILETSTKFVNGIRSKNTTIEA
jgi:hypothetical protein